MWIIVVTIRLLTSTCWPAGRVFEVATGYHFNKHLPELLTNNLLIRNHMIPATKYKQPVKIGI
jgi:hypothetical protein